MYIYKMVYTERDNFTQEEYDFLTKSDIIHETDYGTTEIIADDFNFGIINKTKIIETLTNSIGSEKTEALVNGDIDMIMVV